MANVLAESLATLFLDKKVVPEDWKRANICLTFKKESYEYDIRRTGNALLENQHGLRRNKSCQKKVIKLVADIAQHPDEGYQTKSCVLEAVKKVIHQKINTKLRDMEVRHQVSASIEDCLRQGISKIMEGTSSIEAGNGQLKSTKRQRAWGIPF